MGLVPGINDLMRGFPWPKGTYTSPRPTESRPKLVSFEESGLKSFCESGASSTVGAPFQCSPPSSSHTEVEGHILQTPKYASITQDGWMNTSSWFFELIWKEVKDFHLDDLYKAYFTRHPRTEYGKDHAGNRKARSETLDKAEKADNDKPKENHSKQERDRRERHRWLQREADNTIATFTFNWAREVLHLVKAEAKNAARHESDDEKEINDHNPKARTSHGSKKDAGKDDQLTAAVMTQHLASILICRQHEHIVDQRERIAKLEEKLAYMSQQQQLREERDLPLRGAISNPASTVLQECKGLKRTLYEVEKPAAIISQQPSTSPHPMKRLRHLPKPMMHFHGSHNGIVGSCLLPPSPTPSHDGCASYLFCTK